MLKDHNYFNQYMLLTESKEKILGDNIIDRFIYQVSSTINMGIIYARIHNKSYYDIFNNEYITSNGSKYNRHLELYWEIVNSDKSLVHITSQHIKERYHKISISPLLEAGYNNYIDVDNYYIQQNILSILVALAKNPEFYSETQKLKITSLLKKLLEKGLDLSQNFSDQYSTHPIIAAIYTKNYFMVQELSKYISYKDADRYLIPFIIQQKYWSFIPSLNPNINLSYLYNNITLYNILDDYIRKGPYYKLSDLLLQGIEILLDNMVDPNTICYDGYDPLHFIVYHNDINLVKAVIRGGGDVNIYTKKGETPIGISLTHNAINITALIANNKYYVTPKLSGLDNLITRDVHSIYQTNFLNILKTCVDENNLTLSSNTITYFPYQTKYAKYRLYAYIMARHYEKDSNILEYI